MSDADDPDLDSAYALQTPDDSRRLYARWAETYDFDFAETTGFLLPTHVARAFAKAGGSGPVLDIGAGTGLCGEALDALGIGPVDGIDISPQMLEVAAGKTVYRTLVEGDILARVPLPDASYAGIVSSGTFTHGHVGPEGLDEVLRLARPGALCALSINAAHYADRGFGARFDALAGKISDLRLPEVPIYDAMADDAHKNDTALLALFTKT